MSDVDTGHRLERQLNLGEFVEDLVIVECKSLNQDNPVFRAQCLTHLRSTGKNPGLVINLKEQYRKDGIHRVVNGLQD